MTTGMEPIEQLNANAQAVADALSSPQVASLRLSAEDVFRRALVLSIGSYFEKRVVSAIEEFCNRVSNSNAELCAFVKVKALTRQYHTFFDWSKANTNSFSKLFGLVFHEKLDKLIESDSDIQNGARCFVQLGALRNKLAHEGLDHQFDQSRLDVMRDFRAAVRFVEAVERVLNE